MRPIDPPTSSPQRPSSTLDDLNVSRMLKRATNALLLALGLPLLLLVWLVISLLRSADDVERTDAVIAKVHELQKLLLGAQSGYRGFRLTNDEKFLAPYRAFEVDVMPALKVLEDMVTDNPVQMERMKNLRAQFSEWFRFGDAELGRVRDGEAGYNDPEFLQRGIPIFITLRTELESFIATEELLRDERNAAQSRRVNNVFIFFGVAALFGIPALAVWLQKLLRSIVRSFRANVKAAEFRATELEVTLNSIGDAVVATDAQGRVDFLNPVAEMLMGWTSREAKGKPLTEVFKIYNEDTGAAVDNPVDLVLEKNIVVGLANHTVLRPRNGRDLPIEDSAAPIRNEEGKIMGVILVFHDVTERRDGERLLRESEWRLRLLNNLSHATRFLVDPALVMESATRLLGEYLSVSRCAYAEVAKDGDQFTIINDYTYECESSAGEYSLALFGPRAVSEMHDGKTLIVRDVNAELADDEGGNTFRSIGIRAIICCPLVKDGKLRAMMAVHQIEPRNWTENEILLIQEFVERCWATIERARAESDVRERARLSSLRADIARQLDAGAPLAGTLQGCCDLVARHLDLSLVRIWMLDEKEPVLVLTGSAGIDGSLNDPHARITVGQSKIGRIAQTKQPHLTNDVAHDPYIKDSDWARSHNMQAFAGYPLIVEGVVVGVLGVFSTEKLSEAVLKDLAPIGDAIAQHVERKRAEAALSTSEKLKSAILNTALDGFVVMDHVGILRDWNAAAERIYGVPREDALGRPLAEVIIPEPLREAHYLGLKRYAATGEWEILGSRIELPSVRADGSEFPAELSITHIPDTDPPLFAGYVRDITARVRGETALRQAREEAETSARAVVEAAGRFRLLAEVVSLQVWTANLKGELDFANQECEKYFGAVSEKEILGTQWAQFVHPDDIAGALRAWQKSLSTGERYEVEFRLRSGDGDYRWFLVRAEAMRNAFGEIERWFGTNTDIHEMKAAQSRAEQASRAKDDFLAALSHELRTPLNPVLMTAASLAHDERLPEDVREQLGMVERNIALEARLIDDLLDLTSISRGKLPMRSQLSDAHSLIGLAVEIVRDDANAKSITFERDFAARLTGLMVDPARFQQVVWNLLRNAVKFTPRGGKVSIRTWDEKRENDEEPWLRIEVSDTGVGIEPAQLEKIFLPFEQGSAAGDHRFGGVGLGLAIARAIVDQHGGKIAASSDGPNSGATFVVEFPNAVEPPHGVDQASQDRIDQEPSQRVSLKILLVEDHGPTLQVLTRLLTKAGHQISSATSVRDALDTAAGDTFNLVISDLGLPDGTGIELMQQLREIHKLRGIALSGYGMEDDIARSMEAGFVSHLVKPVDFKQLSRAIENVAMTPPK